MIAPDWAEVLAPKAELLRRIGLFLNEEKSAGRNYLPLDSNILRAFSRPMNEVKVLIVGQDPYPTPGHANGLAFSVSRDVRPLPASLRNIFKEYQADLGLVPPLHGDLTAWFEQGVLLLNRTLTVETGVPGSHRGNGWEEFTSYAIEALSQRHKFVSVLWGKDASGIASLVQHLPVIESAHPSPLAASRGFFGSRPFTRANRFLNELGIAPVHWELRDHG